MAKEKTKDETKTETAEVKTAKVKKFTPPPTAPVDLYPLFLTLEETLGMQNNDPEIAEKYITSKAPTAEQSKEELAALPAMTEEELEDEIAKKTNVFPRNRLDQPVLFCYQGVGACKEGAKTAFGRKDNEASKCINSKNAISETFNSQVRIFGHVQRRHEEDWDLALKGDKLVELFSGISDATVNLNAKYSLKLPYYYRGAMGRLPRPLRAMTPQGERVSLCVSETIPAKAFMFYHAHLFNGRLEPAVREVYANGVFRGFGQWRSSGKGAYVVVYLNQEEYNALKTEVYNIGEDELARNKAPGGLTDADKAHLAQRRDALYDKLVDTFCAHFSAEELQRELARAAEARKAAKADAKEQPAEAPAADEGADEADESAG